MSVRFHEPASEEFRAAVSWYETRRRGLGAEFFDAIVTTVSLIGSQPEIGSAVLNDSRTRRILVQSFPYQVVYRIRPGELVVVAVAHLKRHPDYWKHRT